MVDRNVVTSNLTGAVYRYGYTDFTGQFNPVDFTQITLDPTAVCTCGCPLYYHKVVAGLLVEMNAGEKAAVDIERQAAICESLSACLQLPVFPTEAELPIPPPEPNRLGVIEVYDGGDTALVLSTATGYKIFFTDDNWP